MKVQECHIPDKQLLDFLHALRVISLRQVNNKAAEKANKKSNIGESNFLPSVFKH